MHLPNGAQIFVDNGRGTSLDVTAITNAKDPVLSMAKTTGLSKNDYVIITESSWGKLVSRVVRIKALVADTSITIEGVDTTNKNVFPTGTVTAKVEKVTAWVEIPCVQELSQDGGEQQYYTYQCLSDDQEQQLPTFKSAVSTTYTFAHEYDNAIYPILREADEAGRVAVMRMYVPKAQEMRLWAGVLSFNEIPQTNVNEMETVSVSASLKGKITSISSIENV